MDSEMNNNVPQTGEETAENEAFGEISAAEQEITEPAETEETAFEEIAGDTESPEESAEEAEEETEEAENGKEAVMKTLQDKPDGVFLDIVMPEVGGIEALRVLKEVSPDLPVIMLSSAGTPQKLMETLKLGALDFIQKPYTAVQIKKALDSIRKKAASNE